MKLLIFGLCLAITLAAPRGKMMIDSGAICEGKATAFFVVDNTQMTAGDNVVYKDFSEEECMSTCSNNKDPFGRSILCSSFVYDHVVFTCTIYKDKSKPIGKGEKTAAAGKRYFEKFCLAEDIPMECQEAQFTRADDSVLVGFATNVTLSESLEECVALCVKNVQCMSAMYFYEEGECITNTESAMSRPASFTKEDTEKVIYFSNGCAMKKSTNAKTFKNPIETQPEEPKPTTKKESHEMKGDEYEEKSSGEGSGKESGEKTKKSTKIGKSTPSTSTENTEEISKSEEKQENEKEQEDMKEMLGEEYDDEVSQEKNEENEESTTVKSPRAKKFKKAQKEITTTTQAPDSQQTDDETTTIVESEDVDDQDALLDDGERSYETETEETTTKASKKHSNENTKTLKFKKPAREFASKTVTAYKEDRKKKQKEMERQKELAKNMIDQDEDDDETGENGGEDENGDEEEPVNVIPSVQATEDESTRHPFIKSTEVPADPSSLFSEWSDWTPCTKSGERRVRRRKCLDLRRCLGALMQVENCPAVTTPVMIPEDYDQPPLESVRSIVPEPSERDDFQDQGAQPVPLPPADDQPSVWSPWLGVCQQFASGQPCNNGEMIGFESRECLAKDAAQCTGPFFRYCTLNC